MKNHSLYEVQLNNERVFTVSVTKADDNKLLCRITTFVGGKILEDNGVQKEILLPNYVFDIDYSSK
jgi:hypothetical protein